MRRWRALVAAPSGCGPESASDGPGPSARRARTVLASLATPFDSRPESVGYETLAGTTVVSARTRSSFTTCAAMAFLSSASFSWSTAFSPQRVVIFMSVVGCGTASEMPMRQKRRQARESVTSAHSVSKPSRYRKRRNIMRRYDSIGIEGRPMTGWKKGTNGSKNTGSSSRRSTCSSPGGRRKSSGGRIVSHSVCWASTLVRSNGGSNLFARGLGPSLLRQGPNASTLRTRTRWSRATFTSTFSGQSR